MPPLFSLSLARQRLAHTTLAVVFEEAKAEPESAEGQAQAQNESDDFANLKVMDQVDSSSLFSSVMGIAGKKKPAPTTKSGRMWGKMRKNQTKIITFFAEENEQEREKQMRDLIDDYKKHGKVSTDRQIRVHVDPATNRYLCPMCARKFMIEGNLMAHLELVHLAQASESVQKIHDRRFGFENRSVKLLAKIDQTLQSFRSSHEPPQDPKQHSLHTPRVQKNSESPQHSRQRSPTGSCQNPLQSPGLKSPLEVPINSKHPGRPSDDEENENLQEQLAELRAQARRKLRESNSPPKMRRSDTFARSLTANQPNVLRLGTPRTIERVPSNAGSVTSSQPNWLRLGTPRTIERAPSNASMTSSVSAQSPTARNRSPDAFVRAAGRGITAYVPRAVSGIRKTSSNTSPGSAAGNERPKTSPESLSSKWFLDQEEVQAFDVIHPLHLNSRIWPFQVESYNTYLPEYVKIAGEKGRKFQIQRAHEGVEKRYVSARQKTPDLFADTIVAEAAAGSFS